MEEAQMTPSEIRAFSIRSSTSRIIDAVMPAYLVAMVMKETVEGMHAIAVKEGRDEMMPPPALLGWCAVVNDHLETWFSAFTARQKSEVMRRMTRAANHAMNEFHGQTMVKSLVGVVEFYQIAVDLGLCAFPEGEYARVLDEFLDDVSGSETLPMIERSAKKQGRKILPKLVEAGLYRDFIPGEAVP